MEEYLIKNTTREQREEIVKKSLGLIHKSPSFTLIFPIIC